MKLYTAKNLTLSIPKWAERAGISRQAMANRVKNAKTKQELERALTKSKSQGERNDLEPPVS